MVRELLAVAVRVALQWALASLLVANGAAFCLIAAVSERLRLGPPCILCARVHRLLCSTAGGGEGRDGLRLLLCDAHLAAATTAPEQEARRAPRRDRDKVSGLETHRVVSIGSEICEQNHNTNDGSNDDDEGRRRAGGADDSSNGALVSLFELAPIIAHPRDDHGGEERSSPLHMATPEELHNLVEDGERLTVGQLLSLRAQRRELDALRAELDAERRAREAAEQRRRQAEEQGELDHEAARLAVELAHEVEREKRALQQLLDACRAQHDGGSGQNVVGVDDGGGDNNNYQSLVDFLPGSSVYSSSPDLANLLKLYTTTEPAGNGVRRGHKEFAPAVTVVDEEGEEEGTAVPDPVEAGSKCEC